MKNHVVLTLGGDPLHSSIAIPTEDMRTPNHVRAGTIAPKRPSSKGTTITCSIITRINENFSLSCRAVEVLLWWWRKSCMRECLRKASLNIFFFLFHLGENQLFWVNSNRKKKISWGLYQEIKRRYLQQSIKSSVPEIYFLFVTNP